MRENSMSLHLVGETLDAKRAHLRTQAGKLLQLVRGVYVDAADDVEGTVLRHAIRIARYLYPRAYLSSASALLLGPTPDGRLFISGRRNQRTRLRALEIIQNESPAHPSTVNATVGDDLGEFLVDASSPRQRFLEAFRLRSEHATAITEQQRRQMAMRLVEEYGSPADAADAIHALARENGWFDDGARAERYILTGPSTSTRLVNKAELKLLVAWHGIPLGRLTHDGFEWRWTPAKTSSPPLIRETSPGKLPAFIESLLPEGWLANVLHQKDERDALREGKRYISNIAIVKSRSDLAALPPDVLQTELNTFVAGGQFTGHYAGPTRDHIEGRFEQNLARVFAHSQTPRLSGVQIKAPMYLTATGELLPATNAPFTHILKPAGTSGFDTLPVVEWLCLELGRASGHFEVPIAALIDMPAEMPPALVVERFDIRRGLNDHRLLAMEDFCSILDQPASAKYDGTIERMARALRPISTDPPADLDILFRRALFAWLIADGDMHLKNLAVLKTAEPGKRQFSTVRFAPLYDAVTTRVFPSFIDDHMALKLNGKDDRLTPRDFMTLARTIELPVGRAEAALVETVASIRNALSALSLPEFSRSSRIAAAAQEEFKRIVRSRLQAFAPDDELIPLDEAMRRFRDALPESFVVRAAIQFEKRSDEQLAWLAHWVWQHVPLQVKLKISNRFEPMKISNREGLHLQFTDGHAELVEFWPGEQRERDVKTTAIAILSKDLARAIDKVTAEADA